MYWRRLFTSRNDYRNRLVDSMSSVNISMLNSARINLKLPLKNTDLLMGGFTPPKTRLRTSSGGYGQTPSTGNVRNYNRISGVLTDKDMKRRKIDINNRYIYISLYIYKFTCLHIHMCKCVCIYYICIYMYVYVYICMYLKRWKICIDKNMVIRNT
jgi:hypothetical protein